MVSKGMKCRLLGLVCILAVAVTAAGAQAVTLKVVDTFPTASGTGGWWLHSYEPVSGARVQLDNPIASFFRMPVALDANYLPKVVKSNGNVLIYPGVTATNADRWAVLSYVAPAAGTYSFNVIFSNAAASPGSTAKAYIYKSAGSDPWLGGTKLFEGSIDQSTAAVSGPSSITLASGDKIRFAVSGLGNVSSDCITISDAPIGVVPEPASLLAILGGIAGLAIVRRRK